MNKDLKNILNKAQSDCHRSGVKLTTKRQHVLQLLLQSAMPMSAYEIMAQYKQEFQQALSSMSAYRMLNILEDVGLVHKLTSTNQYIACAHINCTHQHQVSQFLICDQCHQVSEIAFSDKVIGEISDSINATGFQIHNPQMEIHGVCRSCLSNQS